MSGFCIRDLKIWNYRHLAIVIALSAEVGAAQAQDFCAAKGRAWAEVAVFGQLDTAIDFADGALKRFTERRVYERKDGRFSVVTGQVLQNTVLLSPPFPRKPSLVSGCDFTKRVWGSAAANAEDSGAADKARAQQVEGLKQLAPLIIDALEPKSPTSSNTRRCGYHDIDSDGRRVVRFRDC